MYRHFETVINGKSYNVVTLNGHVVSITRNRFSKRKTKALSFVFALCALLFALSARPAQAQFVDRIVRPCPSGSPAQASVIVNPNSTGDIKATTCSGGTFDVNGVPVTPGGPSGSGTAGTLPYFSAPTVLADSPFTRPSATHVQLFANAPGGFDFDSSTPSINLNGTGALVTIGGATLLTIDDGATQAVSVIAGSASLSVDGANSSAGLDSGSGTARVSLTGSADTTNIGDPLGGGNNFGLRVIGGGTQVLILGDTSGGAAVTVDAVTNTIDLSGTNVQVNGVPILPIFPATSASIGGGLLAAGACASTATTVTGAAVGMSSVSTPNTYPGDGNFWLSYISGANTVTTKVCAAVAGTPTASTYNIRVIQ